MEKQEIMKRVLLKIKSRPDIRCISEKYLAEVIDDAIYDVYNYINARSFNDLSDNLITPIKDLCIIRINLTGAEGIVSSSKAGTSETYIDDIPKAVKAKLRKYRRLP